MEEYLSLDQLCSTLGIKKSTGYKLSSKNLITKYKPGGKVLLFKVSDAVKYIESKKIVSNQEMKENVLKQLFKK